MQNDEVRDCTTCDWGKFNDHWNMPFCYCSGECNEWDQWKEKTDGKRNSN